MLVIFKKIYFLLSKKEKRQAIKLLLIILLVAVFDVLGVSSILPFFSILTNPEIVETNQYALEIYKYFDFQSNESFVFFIGLVVFGLLITSLIFKSIAIFYQLHFTLLKEYSIGRRLLTGYLNQPYEWFLNRDSSEIGKNILSEVQQVVSHSILSFVNLVAHGVVSIVLIGMLIVVDYILAITISGILFSAYYSISLLNRKFLIRLGQERFENNELRYSIVNEAFNGIRQVKLSQLENAYINRFINPSKMYAKNQALAEVISQMPRFIIEGIAFGGILLTILYLVSEHSNFVDSIPIIALYTFAGYKLIPSLQHVYNTVTMLKFSRPALDSLYKEVKSLNLSEKQTKQSKLTIQESIKFSKVCFKYPGSSKNAINNISFSIKANETVGIVGPSGSGKSTLLDILLTLLVPQKGSLLVDGRALDKSNFNSFKNIVGYVPQDIFLTNASIASNIAFGIKENEINYDLVQEASRLANLDNFVNNNLPDKYKTIVGEKGVRLSGGQRQRIGIARALYKQPQVLVFDEATSALDNLTEIGVMDAISNLSHKVTIVIVAHRLSTVKNCNNIFLLNNGQIETQGSFTELLEKSSLFYKMANSSKNVLK